MGVGQDLAIRGYVDHANLHGYVGARAILAGWWSGNGPDASTWRIDLKPHARDAAGQSSAVHVPNGGAASRCMNTSGDIPGGGAVAPRGLLSSSTTCPAACNAPG